MRRRLGIAHGAKRWFAYAPGRGPRPATTAKLHPLASAKHWYDAVYADADEAVPTSCLQRAGDVVYLPAGWKHATLNVGETIAVGEQQGYGAAERLLASKAALVSSPRDVEALHGAGISAAHLAMEGAPHLFRDSIEYLGRAAAERPLQPEVNIILAEVLTAAGDRRAAAAAVEACRRAYRAEARTPSRLLGAPSSVALAAVHLKFARFYLGAEMWSNALPPLSDALELRPDYAEALKDRATAYEQLGRPEAAVVDLRAAFALAPSDGVVEDRLRRAGAL